MDNPCNVCQHRHTPAQQDELGHCHMWRVEPHPCTRSHFKLDEFALTQNVMQQLLDKSSPQTTPGESNGN